MTARVDRSGLMAMIVACSMFMAQLDATIVSVALPQMAHSFGVHPVDLSITMTVYLVVQAVFLPVSGWITDRYGARRVFAAAIAVFTLASVLCGLSTTLPTFLAARTLEAMAAALMLPVGRVVLLRSTDRRDLIRVMTISTTSMLIAPTIGPPLGGFITTFLSWPYIFFVNAPIGLLGVALVATFVPNLPRPPRRRFDAAGFALLAISLACLLLGLDRLSAAAGVKLLVALGMILVGLAAGALAVRHALRAAHPLMPLWPLAIPSFAIASATGGLLARLPVRAIPFLLPLMFEAIMGMTAFQAGLLLLAISAGDLMMKTVTTKLLRRFGFRRALMVGALAMSLLIGVCAGFDRGTPWWVVFAVLFASGVARSVTFTGISTLVYADIPQDQVGDATVLWNVAQQATNALGISLAAILLNVAHGPHAVSLADCRFALLTMAAVGLLSVPSFARLRADAGTELSGHRPHVNAAPLPDGATDPR